MEKEVNKDDLGQRIKEIRLSLGETAEVFGNRFDPSANRSLVSAWENGRYIPSPERLKVIAELGNVSVEELLYGKSQDILGKSLDEIDMLSGYSQNLIDDANRVVESPISNTELKLGVLSDILKGLSLSIPAIGSLSKIAKQQLEFKEFDSATKDYTSVLRSAIKFIDDNEGADEIDLAKHFEENDFEDVSKNAIKAFEVLEKYKSDK